MMERLIYRLFYDTVKGGDYRARANVHRLAEVSGNIIDQCVAQGVPFAREYGGKLDNRSFGGVLVSRTFYAKGQTGQQLLLGAYSAMNRQIAKGKIQMYNRHEMVELVTIEEKQNYRKIRDREIRKTPHQWCKKWRVWKCILFIYQCYGFKCNSRLENT